MVFNPHSLRGREFWDPWLLPCPPASSLLAGLQVPVPLCNAKGQQFTAHWLRLGFLAHRGQPAAHTAAVPPGYLHWIDSPAMWILVNFSPSASYAQAGLRFCGASRRKVYLKYVDLQTISHLISEIPGLVFSFPLFLWLVAKFSRSRQNSEDEALRSFSPILL